MRKSLHHFSRLLLVVVVFFASGSHWAVLQTVAWSTMILELSRTGSVAEAVSKTFDGNHPCRLCHEVRKGRESGEEKDAPAAVIKVELFHETATPFIVSRPGALSFPDVRFEAPLRSLCPTPPPPRRA